MLLYIRKEVNYFEKSSRLCYPCYWGCSYCCIGTNQSSNRTCSLHSAKLCNRLATVFRPREAVLSVGLYLLLGAIGLPVFAGGGSGFHALIGPTSGYLWFYLVYSGLTSSLTNSKSGVVKIFLANLLGDALVFVGGIIGLHFLAGMPFEKALVVGVLPFIIPDLGKIIAISFISRPLLQRLKNQAYFTN